MWFIIISHVSFNNAYIKIRMSPQARAFFKMSCEYVDVPFLQLILWIRTRWASLFAFLDQIITLKKVQIQFWIVSLADDYVFLPETKSLC
jgi:hypothetical protein